MNKSIKRNATFFAGKRAVNVVSLVNKHLQFFSSFPGISSAFIFIFIFASFSHAQNIYQPNNFSINQPNNNYMANSTVFRQEIARVEINVAREGKEPLPLTQVPRLEKNDVLRLKLVDEQINGMKPDQSNWDWTCLVAFINPARNNEKEKVVSEEIQFRKTGWYKEYSFIVPYDSQPVIFLYTKPNYRSKILNLITKNQDEIRKIGEKTIELSDAYAKIGSFLNELQYVINRYQYYGGYGNYGTYNSYGTYNPYGTTNTTTGFNQGIFMEQTIERLARSFNIQLPNCGQSGFGYNNGYNPYGTYNNNNGYNPYGTYNNNGYNNYGTYNPYGGSNYGYGTGMMNDFVGRAQCVARSVRIEDLDMSVSRLLQQGGILGAAQLTQKYPQIAFWINVAAAALDVILKVTKKTPLRVVPTIISSSETQSQNYNYQQVYSANQQNLAYSANSYANPGLSNAVAAVPRTSKISLFAEAPPNETNFVTAYPLVIQKWQANPDPEVMSLPIPSLSEPCLHVGQNVLRSTDVLTDWMSDNFTKDFKLIISSPNGFKKEFPLKKNVGLNSWELNVTREDLNAFPKVSMTLDSVITGKRGFNEVRSPKFDLPLPTGNMWEVAAESQKAFVAGGKRRVVLKNQTGSCRCLQTVVYKPSFGGQFVYDAAAAANGQNSLQYSPDGKEVSFEVDATTFQPGQGQLELRQYGGETVNLSLNLYPAPPSVTDVIISKGDNQVIVKGERLEQLTAVKINGKRAIPVGDARTTTNNQNSYPVTNQNNFPAPTPANSSAGSSPNYQNNYQTGKNQLQDTNQPSEMTGNQNNASVATTTQPNISNSKADPYRTNNSSSYPNISGTNSVDPYGANIPAPYKANADYGANTTVTVNQSQPPLANYNAVSGQLNERIFSFEDPTVRQDSNTILLELEVEGNRIYPNPKAFSVSLARPIITANANKEIEGAATSYKTKLPAALSTLPIFTIDTLEISANVQNALTDYDFKVENIQIETRIENSQVNSGDLPKASFEVLDWKNMQITFQLNENFQKFLAGRRLQFRIRDRQRGDSDWYSLRQTFVRIPTAISVKCPKIAGGNCQMQGTGVEYISQASVDGGKTWFPQQPETLSITLLPDGRKAAMIPYYSNPKLLRIRLRDYQTTEGLAIDNLINISSR